MHVSNCPGLSHLITDLWVRAFRALTFRPNLHCTRQYDYEKFGVVEIIVEGGADVNAPERSRT